MTSRDPDGSEPDPDEQPGEDHASFDAEFDAIVAGLELRAPTGDDVPDDEESPDRGPARSVPGSFEELRAWIDVHPDLLADDEPDEIAPAPGGADEEHFVPPPPPPVPRGDPVTRWAWVGAIGAPVVYVLLSLLGFDMGGAVGILLIAGFVAGFVTLVLRMRDGPRVDDGPDDGAVV